MKTFCIDLDDDGFVRMLRSALRRWDSSVSPGRLCWAEEQGNLVGKLEALCAEWRDGMRSQSSDRMAKARAALEAAEAACAQIEAAAETVVARAAGEAESCR